MMSRRASGWSASNTNPMRWFRTSSRAEMLLTITARPCEQAFVKTPRNYDEQRTPRIHLLLFVKHVNVRLIATKGIGKISLRIEMKHSVFTVNGN